MTSFEKLANKLAELFQLDQADLDFGIYRIMNLRRGEITHFLKHDLLPQVRQALDEYEATDRGALRRELEEAEGQARSLGVDPGGVPKVQELRERYAAAGADMTALENQVYDHLYSFFSRYYDDGDFISLRRYKEGVYAIPYEGEEVKLYWANHDQYYIKTTEYFRDYAFRTADGSRVHFKIVEADTEKDNAKAANGKDRRFALHGDLPVAEQNGELVIRFEYRPDDQKRRQDEINQGTAGRVLADLDAPQLRAWLPRLQSPWKRADGTVTDRTLLDKHLYDYTRRNTFDYFIHKDLGGFLRRELDFYIKNEVIRLDDVENESAPRVEQYLAKIRAIRRIAHKIIDFLAQIEDFQKKLWLKKKFVVETQYCVTLDRVLAIPDEQVREGLLREIAANDAQREEWVRLFAIDDIKGALHAPGYSAPLTTELLRANQCLPIDTKHFGQVVSSRLLAALGRLHDSCDGVAIAGENLQALNLLSPGYRKGIRCIYIDPPYNTGSDEFLYKDGYQASSWLCMMTARCTLASDLLTSDGLFFIQIGDQEETRSRLLLESILPERKNTAVVRRGIKNVQAQFSDVTKLTLGHDMIHVFSRTAGTRLPHLKHFHESPKPGKWDTFWRGTDRPTMRYELFGQNPQTGQWRWEENRVKRAVEEYKTYLDHESSRKTLDEWYVENLQAGVDLDFVRLNGEGVVQYYVPPQGYRLVSDNWLDVPAAGTFTSFATEKNIELLERVISWNTSPGDYVLDFFAGSGSTAHAAVTMPPIGDARRKYIVIEIGEHFYTILLPRLKRMCYSQDWKDDKPVSRQGVSHMFKYLRLESYEDALANIELRRTPAQLGLLAQSSSFREEYMLKYMLDSDSGGSPSLLNVDRFDDPFSYQILVGTGSVGELKPVNVDLVETFNWLLGLSVSHMDCIRGYRVVEGEDPRGEKVLVIWRKIRDLSETDPDKVAAAREQANRDLDEFFRRQQYNTLDSEFDLIYVNGDNNLMNIPLAPEVEGLEPRYKVRLVEEEFKRLMFDVQDV